MKDCLTVCTFQGIIGMKCLIEVHQIVQAHGSVCGVVNQDTPVSPVPVRVPDQIVDDIHHVIVMGIQF